MFGALFQCRKDEEIEKKGKDTGKSLEETLEDIFITIYTLFM
jgi:hypothetical protein